MLHRRRFLAGAGSSLALVTAQCAPPGPAGAAAATATPWAGGTVLVNPPPEPMADAVVPVATGSDPLAPLGGVLRAVQRQRGEARGHVMLIGDSHTAGPFLIERLRELFQSRFGSGGIGRLPPGRAQRFFNPSAFRVDQRGDWASQNALRAGNPGPFGLTGYRLTGDRGGDSITLRMAGAEGFDRVQIALLSGPDSGSFRLRVDGARGPLPRIGARRDLQRLVVDVPRDSREVSLELAGDGPVELLGWGVERRGRGVLVEGFGINGATLGTLDNRDRQILLAELAAMPPSLLILEFGTNEATDRDFDAEAYRAALVRWLRTFRAALPRTGLMLMGPADAGRPAGRGIGCAGVTPLPALRQIQAIQREAARAEGVAHFDWAMDVTRSPCRLPALARDVPPLMQRDLVHFTAEGYRLTAERLFNQIMRATGFSQQTV